MVLPLEAFSPPEVLTPSPEASPRLKLKKKASGLKHQVTFLQQTQESVRVQRVNAVVASFLPTSLIEQLHSAVVDSSVNPRLPCERPGVYLCLRLSGLHGMIDLPLESGSLERQLHQIFETIADTIQSCGGDVLRMTGDVVVAKWRLPPPKVPVGQLHAQASSFDARAVVEASREASACAKLLLERLHDRVLFTDTSKEAIKKADAARIARFSKGGSFHSSVPDEDAPASEPSSAASPPKASKWGSAKALVRSKGGKLTQPSGRRMLDAVKAAQKGGVEFKLQLGAALTIACAQTMHVGGANSRWEYVSCANEISAAHVILTQVDSGELLVAESLWSAFPPTALQPHLVLDEWKRLPTQRIKGSVPDRAEEIVEERMAFMHSVPLGPMRQYCPGPIWGKIYAGDPDWIVSQSEVMMITVLMVRMFAPPNAPLHTQVAAYTAAVAIFQRALYEAMGTFKHMMQDSEGCTAVACFGLPPFKHSEVSDSRGAISVAVEMKKQLSKMGLDVHAAVLEGKAWVGGVVCVRA